SSDEIDGAYLICLVSERVPEDYLAMLRDTGISYIVSGSPAIDLARAADLLREHFGIRRLLLEGGGHINGGFLEAGLVDEVSLLLAPTIDGRHDIPTVFDGIRATKETGVGLTLKSVETRAGGTLWIRYAVHRQGANRG
ncbi:MAG TPA: dihydrofolate reductase family protein, partial [Candidatus Ozemobacteraceae bacterium]|nr:dihydrofolate reductase family protein [Candidatus Ozemobacteraceae bacterium]